MGGCCGARRPAPGDGLPPGCRTAQRYGSGSPRRPTGSHHAGEPPQGGLRMAAPLQGKAAQSMANPERTDMINSARHSSPFPPAENLKGQRPAPNRNLETQAMHHSRKYPPWSNITTDDGTVEQATFGHETTYFTAPGPAAASKTRSPIFLRS